MKPPNKITKISYLLHRVNYLVFIGLLVLLEDIQPTYSLFEFWGLYQRQIDRIAQLPHFCDTFSTRFVRNCKLQRLMRKSNKMARKVGKIHSFEHEENFSRLYNSDRMKFRKYYMDSSYIMQTNGCFQIVQPSQISNDTYQVQGGNECWKSWSY